jgi:3-oxoisoapionate decarboxylase
MRLGISTWSLPWSVGVRGYPQPIPPLDAVGLIEKAGQAGVSVVQIADNLPLDQLPYFELDHLRNTALSRGLALEVGTRGTDPEHLRRYIAIAHRLQARVLRTVLSGSMCGQEEIRVAENGIREVLQDLDERQVRLALENNEAFSAAEFAGLIQRVGSPLVGICLDTANSLGRPETLETVVKHLAEHTIMLHAKDYEIKRVDTRMGFAVAGRPAGDGRVDFTSVLAALRSRGRSDISVIIEHWPPFEGSIQATVQTEEEWLAKSVRFLHSKLVESNCPSSSQSEAGL